jgi:hypothetical protein
LKAGDELFVRTERAVSIERLASAVGPMGSIETRMHGTNTYLIQLKPGVNSEKAKDRLEKIPGVRALEPDDEPVEMTSIRSLDRKISHLSSEEHEEHSKGNHTNRARERDKADYLRAYRYFTAQRAYPNDKVNWDALEIGRQHAAKMPIAGLRGKNSLKPLTASSWSFLGPTNLAVPYEQYYGLGVINGRVNSVAFDPTNPLIMYAGGAQGGLWKSTDGGTTWTWLSSTWTQLAVNAIAIDPTNASTIYVARGDYHGEIAGSYGIMKSTDGGTTWSEIAEATMGKVGVASIMLDPSNSQTIIAGTGDINTYGSLYRSTNGGSTWSKLAVGGTDCMWPTIASSLPVSGKVRFYTVAGGYAQASGATTRMFKSDDHGVTWQALPSQVVPDGNFHFAYAVATSPTKANNVYVLDSENMALYTSTSQGGSWNDVSANLPAGNDIGTNYNFSQSFYDYHLECGNRVNGTTNTDILYLGEIDITESADGGNTWTSIGGPTYETNAIAHNDQHCLAVCPTNPNFAIFSNDGGVYSVTYNPATATNTVVSLNKNLGNTMFYKTAFHPTNTNYMLGGTQDNATPISTGDLTNWANVGGGDGGGSGINQNNPQIQYTTSEELVVYRTTDGWTTEQDISPLTTTADNLPFVATMTLDPNNQNLMYVGTNYLYQWNETTQSWTNQLGGQDLTNEANSGVIVQAIAVAPGDTNRIYTGSSDGALWMTQDQGNTWTSLSASSTGLPNAAITSINISPTNENDILVGYSGAGGATGHIFRCTNTVASAPVFTNLTGTGTTALPDVSLNAIARDILFPASTWYVAMDAGVFQTTDSGSTWSNAGSAAGLPNVIVDDLQTVTNGGYLYAGTYGRGMWRLALPTSVGTLTTFTISPTTVAAGGTSTGTITLSAPAPTGGAIVSLSSSATSVATVPASVTVAAGSTTATFTISTNATLTAQGTAIISASYGGVTLTQTLTVTVSSLTITSLTVSPTSVVGGAGSTGTVTLSGASPAGGTAVTLSSSSLNASVPTNVTVLGGATTATFAISTSPVSTTTNASITGTLAASTASASLSITPPSISAITVSPTSVQGGNIATGTVTLNGKAAANGTVVSLSSNSGSATVPTSVTVNPGASTATFNIATSAVSSSTAVTITGSTAGISQTATLTITPATLSRLTLSPSTVSGGATSIGTLTLTGAAGPGGSSVTVTSSSTSATVPSPIVVPAGSSTTNFTITTSTVTSQVVATITGSLAGVNQAATLTINPSGLQGVTVNPASVQGGTSSTGTVTLYAAAPSGGTTITLSSSLSSATVPASVTVASGATTATFTISTSAVSSLATSTITATLAGSPKTATLTITPATLLSLGVSPTSVNGGAQATGSVKLTGAAGPGGAIVALTSSSSSATTPASVTIAAGASSATFTISTSLVTSPVSATITGTLAGISQSAVLSIQSETLVSISVSPTSVVGGNSASGTVTLGVAAPAGGTPVTLSVSGAPANVPPTVTVPAGSTTGTFTIATTGVTAVSTATVSASLNGTTKTASLTLTAATLLSVSFNPSTVIGGNASTGTVTLSGDAPAGGMKVSLSSSSSSISLLPSVLVPAGSSTVSFAVATKAVPKATTAVVLAKLGSVSVTGSLILEPVSLVSLTTSSSALVGGSQVTLTGEVQIGANAGTGGDKVTLKSSNSAVLSVPSTATVPSGSSAGTFAIVHKRVTTTQTVTITATYGGVTKTTTVTLSPFQVTGLSLSPVSVTGGNSSAGLVTLNATPGSGSGAVSVAMTSSTKSASTPSTVSIAVGANTGKFTYSTSSVTSVTSATVTATLNGSSQHATLTILPTSLLTVSVSPTSVQGSSTKVVSGTITLSGPAPAAGAVVTLTSSNTTIATLPASVKIPSGKSSITFTVAHKKVASQATVTISASYGGTTVSTTLTITP